MGFEVKRVRWDGFERERTRGPDLDETAAAMYAKGWRLTAATNQGAYDQSRELWFERETPAVKVCQHGNAVHRVTAGTWKCLDCGTAGWLGPTGPVGAADVNRVGSRAGAVQCMNSKAAGLLGGCSYPSCRCSEWCGTPVGPGPDPVGATGATGCQNRCDWPCCGCQSFKPDACPGLPPMDGGRR